MKRKSNNEIQGHYDLSKARRGKYVRRYAEGANVVVLAPDVARVFRTAKEVNASLRKVIRAEASA